MVSVENERRVHYHRADALGTKSCSFSAARPASSTDNLEGSKTKRTEVVTCVPSENVSPIGLGWCQGGKQRGMTY